MRNTLIIYEGKYGCCEKIAEIMSYIVGNASIFIPDKAIKNLDNYESIVFIFGFYGYDTLKKTRVYIETVKEQLKYKKLALVGVGLAKYDLKNYSNKIVDIIGKKEDVIAFIPGELRLDKLSQEDIDNLKFFSEKTGMKVKDMGELKLEDIIEVSSQIAQIIKLPMKKMNNEELKVEIDNFISTHNTLSLATGYGESVRCSPVEYINYEGDFYIITEGGMKFKGIMQNDKVSFGIYDSYESMDKISGLQISGTIEILPRFESEYNKIFSIRGINIEALKKLPVNLYVLKIRPKEYEFLNSSFKKKGYDSRQYYFTK